MIHRDLNYRGWPEHPPREKGVDVALAIALVESAMLNEYDVAIVFSGDTDLIPAVEMAFRRTTPRVEIAAWSGARPLWFRPRWPLADGSRGVTSSDSRTSMLCVIRRSTSRSPEGLAVPAPLWRSPEVALAHFP